MPATKSYLAQRKFQKYPFLQTETNNSRKSLISMNSDATKEAFLTSGGSTGEARRVSPGRCIGLEKFRMFSTTILSLSM